MIFYPVSHIWPLTAHTHTTNTIKHSAQFVPSKKEIHGFLKPIPGTSWDLPGALFIHVLAMCTHVYQGPRKKHPTRFGLFIKAWNIQRAVAPKGREDQCPKAEPKLRRQTCSQTQRQNMDKEHAQTHPEPERGKIENLWQPKTRTSQAEHENHENNRSKAEVNTET